MTMPPLMKSRWNHLYAIWAKLIKEPTLPQLDRWISLEFAGSKKFGSRDRKWYTELIFAAVRQGELALFVHEFSKKKPTPEAASALLDSWAQNPLGLEMTWTALGAIPPPALFSIVTHRYNKDATDPLWADPAGGLTPSERAALDLVEANAQSGAHTLPWFCLWHGFPQALVPALRPRAEKSGWSFEQLKSFVARQNTRPPLWLRINAIQKRPEIISTLAAEGYEVFPHENGHSLAVSGPKGIYTSEVFRNGLVEVQDLGSQQVGFQVQIKRGQFAWDTCAGGGGKTIQIASQLQNKGAVHASDIREFKLEEVRKRSRRAGFHNVRCFPWDAAQGHPKLTREVEIRGGFDWILVDAPCSSSGTWRRNPDAKFRLTAQGVADLNAIQVEILHKVVGALRPDGHLVYSTCSWLVEENESVVARFLALHPEVECLAQCVHGHPYDDSDTLFSAVFRRRPV